MAAGPPPSQAQGRTSIQLLAECVGKGDVGAVLDRLMSAQTNSRLPRLDGVAFHSLRAP